MKKNGVIDMSEAADKSKTEESRILPLIVRMVIAFMWCWASGFASSVVMADRGTVSLSELPTFVNMAFVGVFLGPGFFFGGLLGRGGSPAIGFVLGLLAYCLYIVLLWVAVTSRKSSTRYAALTVITIASFIAWQGLINSIGP